MQTRQLSLALHGETLQMRSFSVAVAFKTIAFLFFSPVRMCNFERIWVGLLLEGSLWRVSLCL